jgi:hypothetical protein
MGADTGYGIYSCGAGTGPERIDGHNTGNSLTP